MRTVKYIIILAVVFALGCGGSTAFRSGKTYLLQDKNYEKAENFLRQATQEEPDNWEAHYFLALALAEQEKYSEAKASFIRARELAPDPDKEFKVREHQKGFFTDHAKRGITALRNGEYREAAAEFKQAVAVYDEDPVGFVNLGVAYSNMSPTETVPDPTAAAMEAFEQAVEVDPTSIDGWRNLGISYRNNGQYEEAMEAFGKVVELDPEDLDALLARGDVAFSLQNYEKALESYSRAAEIDPENWDLQFSLGAAYFNQDRIEEAGMAFQKAAAGAKDSNPALYEDAMYRLGFSYVKIGNYEAAIPTLQTLIEFSPKPEYYELLGTAYTKAKMTNEAVEAFQKAKELRGN